MEKIANIPAFNDAFIEMVSNGQEKSAAASAQKYTRITLREDSITEKILTPIDITNDQLDKSENPELLVKWNDREPDTAPAVVVPLGVVPDAFQFTGTRYGSYFSRIMTQKYSKDVDALRGFDYDIRQVLLEISTKEVANKVDSKFFATVDSILGTDDTINPLNGMGLIQRKTFAGITRDNVAEAFKVIQRLNVPFGPMQPDGGESKGVMVMNTVTAQDFVKMGRSEVGGDAAQETWINGLPTKTLLGVKPVYTIKRDIVPDGVVYLFSSEEFFGKYYRLQPLTVFMKNEAFFLEYFQYMNISLAIGNVRGACRIDFNG